MRIKIPLFLSFFLSFLLSFFLSFLLSFFLRLSVTTSSNSSVYVAPPQYRYNAIYIHSYCTFKHTGQESCPVCPLSTEPPLHYLSTLLLSLEKYVVNYSFIHFQKRGELSISNRDMVHLTCSLCCQ